MSASATAAQQQQQPTDGSRYNIPEGTPVSAVEQAIGPDGAFNPHKLFLPNSGYFNYQPPRPSPHDGLGVYGVPSQRNEPRYRERPAEDNAEQSATESAAASGPLQAHRSAALKEEERRTREEASRLAEYRMWLGLPGAGNILDTVKDYKPRERPPFVPFVVRADPYKHDRVKWEPPAPPKPQPLEISTATAVETPIPPRVDPSLANPHDGLDANQQRIVAYDDGDPFAFPVRPLPQPEPVQVAAQFNPRSFATVPSALKHEGAQTLRELAAANALSLMVLRNQLLLFLPHREAAFRLVLGEPAKGWELVSCTPGAYEAHDEPADFIPRPRSVLVPLDTSHVLAFDSRWPDTLHALALQSMTWVRLRCAGLVFTEPPTFAHSVSAHAVYVRSSAEHFVVTFSRQDVSAFSDPRPGDEVLDYRRFRLHAEAKRLRSAPSADELTAVPDCAGVAVSTTVGRRGDVHTWIFRYEPKAMNWLPHERIEFAHPKGVRIGSKVLFFAADTSSSTKQRSFLVERTGVCIVAAMNLTSGEVVQPQTTGDVRIMLEPEGILCFAKSGLGDNLAVCVTADAASFILLEVDRWSKVKGWAYGAQ